MQVLWATYGPSWLCAGHFGYTGVFRATYGSFRLQRRGGRTVYVVLFAWLCVCVQWRRKEKRGISEKKGRRIVFPVALPFPLFLTRPPSPFLLHLFTPPPVTLNSCSSTSPLPPSPILSLLPLPFTSPLPHPPLPPFLPFPLPPFPLVHCPPYFLINERKKKENERTLSLYPLVFLLLLLLPSLSHLLYVAFITIREKKSFSVIIYFFLSYYCDSLLLERKISEIGKQREDIKPVLPLHFS